MNKRNAFYLLILLVCLGSVVSGYLYYRWAVRPLPFSSERLIRIEKGMTGRQIGRLLEDSGVIHSVREFRIVLRLRRAERDLTRGVVKLSPPLTMTELIRTLQKKHPLLQRVFIQEGWPSWKIFRTLERELGLSSRTLRTLFENEAFLKSLDLNSSSLEGYLFPDTYHISREASAREVLQQLVERFHGVAGQLHLRQRAREHGLSLDEAVRLASLIEKEARVSSERNLISAVFHNRLDRRMPLQSDPTILYWYEDFSRPITESLIQKRTPYNTYQFIGLPPGAISNPGRSSLEASVNPADVSFLYFVARPDGRHEFNTTYRGHREAVQKYQR